jgi:iron(III) transport system substrate-binding protein
MASTDSFARATLLLAAILVVGVVVTFSRTQDEAQLVIYCSADAAIAEPVIRQFEQQTGLRVDVRFDEEANKSLGLTNLLIAEQQHPRCDVYWNNQTLGTIRLQKQGILQPYTGSGYQRIPAAFKDPDGFWTGFAARLRVYIINTDRMQADEPSILAALQADSLSQVAIAQPMFGTTLSHYSVLADLWGPDQLKSWHQSLHDRGIRQVRGNSLVKDLVAEGICALGFTDTDDAFVAIDDGLPVSMLPVRLENGSTVAMPNSAAMIHNCPHPETAARFMDYLLSEEVELLLSQSAARQIPLGPVDETALSDEVRELKQWAADGLSLEGAAEVNAQVLDWLTQEYVSQ